MPYHYQTANAFPVDYLDELRSAIHTCPYFSVNNLNRDFIGTKGFSVVFTREGRAEVDRQFPFFSPYLDRALQPDCNAFYLNPLLLNQGSRVDPHIDRSLRSYCKTVEPPAWVSVLYIQVPTDLTGGNLILRNHRQQVGQVKPKTNTLIRFQGNLTHSINAMTSAGSRLSLVCEQYDLTEAELADIPRFRIESRVLGAKPKGKTSPKVRA